MTTGGTLLAALLGEAAGRDPDGTALVDAATGAATTWRALDEAADRVAGGLGRLGCVAGNRVLVSIANRTEFVALYFGALRARLVVVPVNPRLTTGELLRTVTDCRPRVVVADAATADLARAVVLGVGQALGEPGDQPPTTVEVAAVPRLVLLDVPVQPGETAYDALAGGAPAELPAGGDPEGLAVLLYTSGTSDRPRAAMLSHRALVANVDQAARVAPPLLRPDDVVYGVLPLFHVYGLNGVLGQVVRQGARLVVADGFEPSRALDDVERHDVTVVPVAPPVLAHWRGVPDLAARLAGVRYLLSGSAPLAPELVEHYDGLGVTLHQGYGLTEAAPVVTSTLASGRRKPGSVGAPLPGVELRVVDERGHPVEGEDPGEILVAGANLFGGYWPDGVNGPGDGWLATGDVGYLDPDGDLFLVDRVKDIVIVSGFNVYPIEVEEVIAAVPGVAECAVVGEPSAETGEAVVAYVRPVVEPVGGDGTDAAALAERVREACELRLARFKRPVRVEVVAALPRTATGTIARGRLRAAVRRGADELLG